MHNLEYTKKHIFNVYDRLDKIVFLDIEVYYGIINSRSNDQSDSILEISFRFVE